ncbi:MAG: 50S ribosomal protein L11 methyltransferase [Solirubrobacteraceae bacterium MAG38_C4-C5]|nr:50S ribosomal protein L11 methyltransferase [Candidatus Siliceabacter maunaloa]
MIRLAIRVRREEAEVALAELLTLAPGGVEEIDLGDRVEYAVYGAPGELPALPDVEAAVGGALVEVVTTTVDDDWADRWRAFHQPVVIGERLHIRPPWAPARDDLIEVVIDPGQAFGTGAHDTTRLCLELLLQLEPDGPLMDLGCGSGVLAVAAAKLGFGPVHGIDHEQQSIEATHANARANGTMVQATRFDLLRDGPAPSAPTTLANLLCPLLLDAARTGFAVPTPNVLIASGLLTTEADEVAQAFAQRHGFEEHARKETDTWAALLLRRPG